jgi:hypothetical protein
LRSDTEADEAAGLPALELGNVGVLLLRHYGMIELPAQKRSVG